MPSRYGARGDSLGASPAIVHTVTRVKAGKPAKIDVPSAPNFHPPALKNATASPVRRKPVPPSASPSSHYPSLSSGGRLVALGEESDQHSTLIKPKTPRITPNRPAWLAQATSPPMLVPRDLDQ